MIYILLICYRMPFKHEWVEVDEKAYIDRAQAEAEGRAIMARNRDVVAKIKTYREVSN